MKLISIHRINPFFMREVILTLDTIVIVGIGETALSIERVFNHAHNQEHQGHNHKRDGAHGEQNQRQNGKASLARPIWVRQRLVAERLHALAHRFEGVDHGRQCTPMHSGMRKYVGGAL